MVGRAVAGAQGGLDADDRVEAGEDVDERDAHLGGLAAGLVALAGDAHEPADGLHEQVVTRQVAPGRVSEARDRAVDHSGVLGRDGIVAEAELLHGAGFEVLDDHVGGAGELGGAGDALGIAQVAHHRALAAVDAREVGALPDGVDGGPPLSGAVALGALDLDDVGAEVGEDHGRVRPGEHAGEVCDADPGEGSAGAALGRGPLRCSGCAGGVSALDRFGARIVVHIASLWIGARGARRILA
jgi:hypothetical protein